MEITCEISLYPLEEEYEKWIFLFIDTLKKQELQVYTNAMSTYVVGASDAIFSALSVIYESQFMQDQTSSLVVKIINKKLPIHDGFLSFET